MAYATRSITGLPPSLFSEGAVVINPNPIVDYANNVAARNQARQDAFTKYYADLGNNINTAGVHADDIPDIFSKKNDWQQFNMDHRSQLMNPSLDNGVSYAQSNRLYNQALSIAQQSKSKVANLASIKSILDDPKKSALLTDGAVQSIHNASLKVTDPNYKAIDPTDINFNPKPFDLGDQARVTNVLKSIKPQQIPGVPIQDRNTGMQTQPFTAQYDKDGLNAMYQLGSNLYSQHPGFKADVDKHASIDDPDYARLNAIYQQHFTPKNGFNQNITTPEDMAAAKIVAMNPNSTISPKITPLPAQSAIGQQNAKDRMQFSSDLALKRAQAERAMSEAYKIQDEKRKSDAITTVANNYWDGIKNSALPVANTIDPANILYKQINLDAKTKLGLASPDKLGVKVPIGEARLMPNQQGTYDGNNNVQIYDQKGNLTETLPEQIAKARIQGDLYGKASLKKSTTETHRTVEKSGVTWK